jgi:CspA family cold shock protein
MQQGYIKMYDSLKGFGFITTEDEEDVYFSKQDIHPKSKNILLKEGLKVGFDIKREMRGDRAVNVRILK